jgi:inorganic triphosphatase YgiF
VPSSVATAEIELKLAIDPGAAAATVAAVLRHPAVVACKRGRWHRAQVTNTYFDTPDWRLAEAGLALRLRRYGARWLQTVKGPPLAEAGGGMHARAEYEWPVAGAALDPSRLATTPWRKLIGEAIAGDLLAPRFTTDFERRTVALVFPDGTRGELCIDLGAIRVAGRPRQGVNARRQRAVIAEIEIELATGSAARLYDLALDLTRDLPLAVATASKAERGFALAHGHPDGWHVPLRAHAVPLAAQAAAPDALRTIALDCLQQIAANAPGLLADADPEWVHQMRIGTRRLRSCLALAARYLAAEAIEPLIAEQKWLAGALGAARDWDVFATETVPPFAAQFAADPALAADIRRLRARIARQRTAARAAARAAVRSPRFQHLVLGVGALCSAPRHDAANPRDRAAGDDVPTVEAFARKRLERRHRRLLQRADACTPGTREERHALRIAAKKQRYAAEFFAPLLQRKRARAYVDALAGLQDVLGRGNDAVTAARLVALVARGKDDRAATALRGWIAAQGAAAAPLLAPAWARFARTRRFWTGD